MEEDNYYIAMRHEELSMEDKGKVSDGRKRFRAKNDGAALDGAEILFRMNRQKLNMENAAKSVEVMEHGPTPPQAESSEKLVSSSGQPIIQGCAASFDRQPPFGYNVDGTKLPRLPPFRYLQDIIEKCSKPFAKQLTQTDMSRTHTRLSFNQDDVHRAILPFLRLMNHEGIYCKAGIPVTTYDPRGKKYKMVFKSWAERKVHVLNTVRWNQFVADNELVESRDWVSVWMFSRKMTGNLCFALDINRFPTPEIIKKRSKRGGCK